MAGDRPKTGGRDHIEEGLLAALAYVDDLQEGDSGKDLAERIGGSSGAETLQRFAEDYPEEYRKFTERYEVRAVSWSGNWDIDQKSGYQGILVVDQRDGTKRFIARGVSPLDELGIVYEETYETGFAESQYRQHESFFRQLVTTGEIDSSDDVVAIGHSLGFQLQVVLWANVEEYVPEYSGKITVKGYQGFGVNTDVDKRNNEALRRQALDRVLTSNPEAPMLGGGTIPSTPESRASDMSDFARGRIRNVQKFETESRAQSQITNVYVSRDIVPEYFPQQGRTVRYFARDGAIIRPHQLGNVIPSLNHRVNNGGKSGSPDFGALSPQGQSKVAGADPVLGSPIGSPEWRTAMEEIYDRHQFTSQENENGRRTSSIKVANNLPTSSNDQHRLALKNTSIQFPFESAEAEAVATREAIMAEVFDRMSGRPEETKKISSSFAARGQSAAESALGRSPRENNLTIVEQPAIPNGPPNRYVGPPSARPSGSLVDANELFRRAGIESLFAPEPYGGYRGGQRDQRNAAIDKAIGIMGFKDSRDIGGFVFDLNDPQAQPGLRRQLAARLRKSYG